MEFERPRFCPHLTIKEQILELIDQLTDDEKEEILLKLLQEKVSRR